MTPRVGRTSPAGTGRGRFRGRMHESQVTEAGLILMIGDVLAEFSVALLERLTGLSAGREGLEDLRAATAGQMLAQG